MAAVSHDSPCGASLTRNTTTAVGKSSTADGAYLGSFGALSLADTRTALVAHAHPRRLQSCSTPPPFPAAPRVGWALRWCARGPCTDGVYMDCARGLCAHRSSARTTAAVAADCATSAVEGAARTPSSSTCSHRGPGVASETAAAETAAEVGGFHCGQNRAGWRRAAPPRRY